MIEYREGGTLVVCRHDKLHDEPIGIKLFDSADCTLHYISVEKAVCLRNLLDKAINDYPAKE
jgi:hypothetical protein